MEKVKKKCKVCGKEFKNLNLMHVRTHGMNMEQYEAMSVEDIGGGIEPTGNTEISKKEMDKRIWGDQEKDVNRPLSEFLGEFGLTEIEARNVLKKFVKGDRIDPRIKAKNDQRMGMEGAEKLKDQDKAETTSLAVAEQLSTSFGFTVTDVRGARGNQPKTWFLVKG